MEDMQLHVDKDGFIGFRRKDVRWSLHLGGWEAYIEGDDVPFYCSETAQFPSQEELEAADDKAHSLLYTTVE